MVSHTTTSFCLGSTKLLCFLYKQIQTSILTRFDCYNSHRIWGHLKRRLHGSHKLQGITTQLWWIIFIQRFCTIYHTWIDCLNPHISSFSHMAAARKEKFICMVRECDDVWLPHLAYHPRKSLDWTTWICWAPSLLFSAHQQLQHLQWHSFYNRYVHVQDVTSNTSSS